MTFALTRTSLGTSPLTGDEAISDCVRFKTRLHAKLGRVDNAFALTVRDDQQCRVEAAYDPDDAQAEKWVREALDCAPELWGQVARTGRERVR